jgi:hypothetical protein
MLTMAFIGRDPAITFMSAIRVVPSLVHRRRRVAGSWSSVLGDEILRP